MLNEILGFQIIIQLLDYVIKTPPTAPAPPKSLLNYGVTLCLFVCYGVTLCLFVCYGVTLWEQTKAEVFCSILPLRPISFLLVELHERKKNI